MKKEIRIIISAGVFVILLAGTLFLYYHNPKDGLGLVCPIYTLTGYYCPDAVREGHVMLSCICGFIRHSDIIHY